MIGGLDRIYPVLTEKEFIHYLKEVEKTRSLKDARKLIWHGSFSLRGKNKKELKQKAVDLHQKIKYGNRKEIQIIEEEN